MYNPLLADTLKSALRKNIEALKINGQLVLQSNEVGKARTAVSAIHKKGDKKFTVWLQLDGSYVVTRMSTAPPAPRAHEIERAPAPHALTAKETAHDEEMKLTLPPEEYEYYLEMKRKQRERVRST